MSYQAAVITVSDKGFRGERRDTSGPAVAELLRQNGWDVARCAIVPDEPEMIRAELLNCTDTLQLALVVTTGGTGFSPRDITPEVTRELIQRETPGIPETMRAESMKVTPRGCLSRSAAGIRGKSLIVNLPGSEKAALENLACVIPAIGHGVDMLYSAGSADCAAPAPRNKNNQMPSMDAVMREARQADGADQCGMYLFHHGVVRRTARAEVRMGQQSAPVIGMQFSYDAAAVAQAEQDAMKLPGIYYAKIWLNEGHLQVGDPIMLALVGGDIRDHVIAALQTFVGQVKKSCVTEQELY